MIPHWVPEHVHPWRELPLVAHGIGDARDERQAVRPGDGGIDGNWHQGHGVAPPRPTGHVRGDHERAHRLLRRRKDALGAHDRHRIVLPLVLAGDRVQAVRGHGHHLLAGVEAGVDGLDPKTVLIAQEDRQVHVFLRGDEVHHPITVGMFHVDDAELEPLLHRWKHEPPVVERACKYSPQGEVERAGSAFVGGEHEERLCPALGGTLVERDLR